MPSSDGPPSPSGGGSDSEYGLAYYKAQYEQLESDLAEFQASSKDIEAELEKDIEATEKRERDLRSKAEQLGYEVEEWKTKYKQAKLETNATQNALQKEITTLRDSNRTLHLKLRDIEVANDDFERQARNTTSSLEDLESKYNVGIERGVMLEEEIKVGEQEREALRIEAQRLRDELSDLRIEAEITQNKLQHAESHSNYSGKRKPTPLGPGIPQSPFSEQSPATTTSSPTFATPPTKSTSSSASDAPTPPSPPLSESSTPKPFITPSIPKTRLSMTGSNTTPRPSHFTTRPPRHSRGPSTPFVNGRSTPSIGGRRSMVGQPTTGKPGLPQSGSLLQIKALNVRMQKLEERVHTNRSKLPAPVNTPPRASPRDGSAMGQSYIPPSVTVRSHKKRTGGSNISGASSIKEGVEPLQPPSVRPLSRLSFGGPPQTPTRAGTGESRPSSRQSTSSRSSFVGGGILANTSRPPSRQDMSGTRTPLGHHSANPTESRRPRSAMSNHAGHGYSMSVSHVEDKGSDDSTPTQRRRTLNRHEIGLSAIPTPGGAKKRQSGVSMITGSRRISSGPGAREEGDMAPPVRKTKLSEVGESY